MPVEVGLGLDFHVALHRGLAGQSQPVFVVQAGEKSERVQEQIEFLPQPLLTDVLGPFLDLHATRTAHAHSLAVERLVDSGVHLDPFLPRGLAEIGSRCDFDSPLFLHEFDAGHGCVNSDAKRQTARG